MVKKGYCVVFYRSASGATVQADYAKVSRPANEAAGERTLAAGKPAMTRWKNARVI